MDNMEVRLEEVCSLFKDGHLSEAVRVFANLVREKAREDCTEWAFSSEGVKLLPPYERVLEFESKYFEDMTLSEYAAELSKVIVMRADGSEMEWLHIPA